MILDATNRSIEIKLGATVTTNQLPVVCAYADHDAVAKTYVPGAQTAITNNTTAVTIVSAPASSKQRQIKSINIQNKDTAAIKVTVQYNDNATIRELITVTLTADDTLQYDYEEGWRALDSVGKLKVQVGTGGGGGLSDADYGDITVSGGGTVMTIDPNVVVYSKMQDVSAASRLLGRGDSGAGDPQELTVGAGLSIVGTQLEVVGGGVSIGASWNYDTATTATDPGTKKFKMNNAAYASVTALYINDTTIQGIDFSNFASILATGNRIYIQQKSDATKAVLFEVTGAATDNTGWWTIPVVYKKDTGVVFTANAECIFVFSLSQTNNAREDFYLSGDISPTAITGINNDYSPTGLATASVILQDCSADAGINGLTGGSDGRVIILINKSAFLLEVRHEAAGSTAANRFALPGSNTLQICPNSGAILVYDSTASRWRLGGLTDSRIQSLTLLPRLTPAQITADQNDYTPTGLNTSSYLDINSDATRNITGIFVAATGKVLMIHNSGSFNIVLKHESASSVASNRFNLPGAVDYTIEPGELVMLFGSVNSTRWRMITNGFKLNSVGNTILTDMAANTIKGNNTGVSADPIDLSVAQVTAMLNAFVGDSGSGGTKGLVPAPAAGDAAAAKFLKADGTWATTPGGGGGDSITVNGVALVDADFDDATPAAVGTGKNVKWQKDASSPANVSAYVEAAGSAVAGIITTGAQNIGGEKTFDADVNFAMEVAMSGVLTASPSANQNDYAPSGIANASILRLTPSASIIITGIGSTKNGKRLLVVNASTDFLIMLIPESAASTAANMFSFPIGFPFLAMMPGDTIELWYDNTSSRWRPLNSQCINPVQQFDEFTDWPAPPNNSFVSGQSGTGAAVRGSTAGVGATEKVVGAIEIATGTTSTGKAWIASNGLNTGNGFAPAQGCFLMACRGKPTTLSDGTNRYQVRLGCHDGGQGTNVTDGVYFEYDDATSGDWRTGVAAASARTLATITGFTVSASVYHILGIFVNANWTRADFFYSTDGLTFQFATSVSSGLPSSTQLTDGMELNINKTIGTADRPYAIDWCGYRTQTNRG